MPSKWRRNLLLFLQPLVQQLGLVIYGVFPILLVSMAAVPFQFYTPFTLFFQDIFFFLLPMLLIFMWGKNLFEFVDFISGVYTIPLLIFITCIFMGWKVFPIIVVLWTGAGHQSKTIYRQVLRVIASLIILALSLESLFQ